MQKTAAVFFGSKRTDEKIAAIFFEQRTAHEAPTAPTRLITQRLIAALDTNFRAVSSEVATDHG